MKLSRRNAIGALIGGATAGPEIARKAAEAAMEQEMMRTGTTRGLSGLALMNEGKDASQSVSLTESIARYQKIANGELFDWQLEEIERHKKDSLEKRNVNVSALKSVSEQHKTQMRAEAYSNQVRNRYIEDAKRELARLLKINPF